ncbi:hypothetical protein SATMO3_00130 [Sporomusa aerivorans]
MSTGMSQEIFKYSVNILLYLVFIDIFVHTLR